MSRVSIAAGKKIGAGIQIGMNLGYTLYDARGYASRGEAEAGIGVLLPLNDRFRIGIQLNRLNAAWGSKEFGFLARAGAGYRLSDVCSLTLEIIKEAGKPVLTDAGIFYAFHSHIYTRLGFNPSLSLVNFSIGYRNHHLRAEMGQAIHILLGSTWGLNIMYIFNDSE